jgi:pimeloyl-ACP methyl ester carboxylesterase
MIENYTSEPIHYQKIGAINYAYFKKGSGLPVILLHGFPDNAIGWNPTMNSLNENGFETVAPFLRGYYPTGLSAEGNYSVSEVAKDMLALADALGYTTFYLIGHDWGASIAYQMASLAPDRIVKLVAVAIPHPRAIRPSIKLLYQARHFVLFQMHTFSLWYTKRNNYAYIDYIYKWWSPKWKAPEKFTSMMKACFDEPGYLDAALGYYRSFGKDARDKKKAKFSAQKTTVPTLVIVGDSDGALDNVVLKNMNHCYTNSFQLEWIQDAGHFPHQEKPELFANAVVKYLKSN